ncbi:MAG: hypothetical protein ABI707_15725 [Ferruginibacter sp.]
MKNLFGRAIHFLLKLVDKIFAPLKGLPVPDFNNIYDETIL